MDCRVFAPRKEPLLLSVVNDSVVRISPPSRWNGAPTTARKHRCSLMGVLFCLGRRTEGVQVVSGKHLPVSVYANFAGSSPQPGADAPTTARKVGLLPRGGQYFLSKRKKVPKKASGTATTKTAHVAARRGLRPAVAPSGLSSASARCAHPPGKSPLLPILTAGLAMSRAMELDSVHQRLERARARLFPPSKWAGLFPSAAYRRSALPQLALGRLKWRCLGCLDADCVASQHRKTGLIFSLQLALSIHK